MLLCAVILARYLSHPGSVGEYRQRMCNSLN
jgi:hypothetical protein